MGRVEEGGVDGETVELERDLVQDSKGRVRGGRWLKEEIG